MIGIIIPTYDSLDTLKVLVDDVYKYTSGQFKVYIIEDGLRLDTTDYLCSLKNDNLKVVLHKHNVGIAPSWNEGLVLAERDGCEHFAIFNDDIELCENWWERCKILFNNRTHLVGLSSPCPIPLTGWFFILDRVCLYRVGYFDEQFLGYTAEDFDYYLRYKQAGFTLGKADIKIFHHGSKTMNKVKAVDPVAYKERLTENWWKLKNKHKNLRTQA